MKSANRSKDFDTDKPSSPLPYPSLIETFPKKIIFWKKVNDASVLDVLNLIHPKLESQLLLAKQVALLNIVTNAINVIVIFAINVITITRLH